MPERQTSPEVSPDKVGPNGASANVADPEGPELHGPDPDGVQPDSAYPDGAYPEGAHPDDADTTRLTADDDAGPRDAGPRDAIPTATNGSADRRTPADGAASDVPPTPPALPIPLPPTAAVPSSAAPTTPVTAPPAPVPASPAPTPPPASSVPPAGTPSGMDGVTEVMPAVTGGAADAPTQVSTRTTDDAPTEVTDGATDDAPTELIPVAKVRKPGRARRRALLLTGGLVALLALLYVVDLVQSSGMVPRGVTVAGQEVGGLPPAEAEQRVRAAVEPRTTRPIDVAVGAVTSQLDPQAAGLSVDWTATIEKAGSQPLNPITRVRSFFTTREVAVATVADDEALDSALQQLAPVVNRPPAEGTVRFEGINPVPVPPVDGQELDLAEAREVLVRDWTNGTTVQLPMRVLPPTTTEDDVTKAVTDVATPAVSGPVTVIGENVTGTISPEVIAQALSFRADTDKGLVPELNKTVIEEALDPQLASSEQPGRDAALSFAGGRPVVTPSQDGRGVDYDATLKDLLEVLTRTGDERSITAVYAAQPAELTTEELNGLGITGVIGEFTTGGFAQDSGRNIRRAAQVINGMIVKPGETFSLNRATEPRNAANGYVEAGIISEGHASRGVGGGVSQVATTLYNAAYFAGMSDLSNKPHSFYISRYPAGREATVFEGAIDLRFRNDGPTGVLIQTAWTPGSITVRLYGTKRFDVTSSTGPRTKPTEPTKVDIPDGEPCAPSAGAPGFTITDTRTLRDVKTGQVRTERRTTKYNPSPIVTCGSD